MLYFTVPSDSLAFGPAIDHGVYWSLSVWKVMMSCSLATPDSVKERLIKELMDSGMCKGAYKVTLSVSFLLAFTFYFFYFTFVFKAYLQNYTVFFPFTL